MIYGKVGNLGHGKTLRMVVDGVELARIRGGPEGRCHLASNIKITARDPKQSFSQLPMDGFSQALAHELTRARAGEVGLVVLLDEVDTIWDAHEWQAMRKSDRYRIKQSRKLGADLIWSAQFVDQVEKSVRNITSEVELVRAYPDPSIRRREAGKRPWVIRGQRFRPGAVRELTGTPDADRRLGSAWHRYRRDHELLYNTDELVMPPDDELEQLCARHKRERSEERCPVCHPARDLAPLHELVTEAATPHLVIAGPEARSEERSAP